jgi:Phage tail sheath C-terminal domain
MSQSVLLSPGVKVTITTEGPAPVPTPTTVPLIFLATRANKPTPDGSGIAPGTTESNVYTIITSQTELLDTFGNIAFVTADGEPIQGDETNEYGLITAYTVCGITQIVAVVRANIDLGQLVPTTVEPVLPAPDGTFWIDSAEVVGGIFTFNGSTWTAVPFQVFLVTPLGTSDGADGDWGFDYSTLNGTLVFRASGVWYAASNANLTTHGGATDDLFISSTTPVGAVAGDFWYKTTSSGGGTNLALTEFTATTQVWVIQAITRATSAPSPVQDVIWEDDSQIAATGNRPLYIGTGSEFIPFPIFVQATPPVTPPAEGTLWFDPTITDFAMYVESGNLWVPITTTTVSNPSNTQKVISASPPQFPQQGAIWVSVATPLLLDNFPTINYWTGSSWEVIPIAPEGEFQFGVYIQSADPVASLVTNGSYWINTGDPLTTNTVKAYDTTFQALTVNDSGATVPNPNVFWAPQTGHIFGRLSQRQMVVQALKEVIASNQEIRAEVNYYQLMACPNYVETYDDISSLNQDISQIALGIFDVPKFVIPSGVATGRELTISNWITNANNVSATGENGFIGAPDPFQANLFPGGLATNPTDGTDVYVPPSYIMLRTIAYSDSVSFPWFPPAGPNRGIVTNVASVGSIDDEGEYSPFNMNRSQRDICYTQSVNPVANIPNIGLCVWGQKTMAIPGDITDRINVVRLLAKMKYDFQLLMEPYLFELNNATTQRNATLTAERYLAGLVSLNAIYDYAVLCNSTNNTPSIVAQHQLIVDVAIQPEISVEFIYVPILVLYPDQPLPFVSG